MAKVKIIDLTDSHYLFVVAINYTGHKRRGTNLRYPETILHSLWNNREDADKVKERLIEHKDDESRTFYVSIASIPTDFAPQEALTPFRFTKWGSERYVSEDESEDEDDYIADDYIDEDIEDYGNENWPEVTSND